MNNKVNEPLYEEKAAAGRMFDRIYKRYDLLNHVLTMRLDVRWRKLVAKRIQKYSGNDKKNVLDIATGTGDLALAIKKHNGSHRFSCLDVSPNMMKVAEKKVDKRAYEDFEFVLGDAAALPFEKANFDFISIGFGVRNFPELDKSLSECCRVLNKGGRMYVLEFGWPENVLFSALYSLFSRTVIPLLGWMIAGDRAAYEYLRTTIKSFPYGEEYEKRMVAAGFEEVSSTKLAGGIVYLYEGVASAPVR